MFSKKCIEFENKIYEFIRNHIIQIGFAIVTIFALWTRFSMLDFETWDYTGFLKQWYDFIIENGRIHSLNKAIGDYNCPYIIILTLFTYLKVSALYCIKIFSIIFDFILAISGVVLVKKITKQKGILSLITYSALLFLPTMLLNGACWAQCDSIYASFIVISLIFLIDEKYIRSLIFLGIAFAFKLQFMFILPLYILIWINKRKFPLYYFGILPIVNFIMCLPSVIMGRSIRDVLMIYVRQTGSYSGFTSNNFPSMYNIFCKITEKSEALKIDNIDVAKIGIIITITIYAMMAFYLIYKKVKLSKENIIEIGLWSVVIATFFMPNMHDRYMFVADILSVILFLIYRNKKTLLFSIIINLNSFSVYIRYLFGAEFIDIKLATILQFIVVIGISLHLHKEINVLNYKGDLSNE